MRSLASERPDGKRRDAAAKERLRQAYASVFRGSADAELVLADLANYCGYYKVHSPEVSMSVAFDHNARRAVFGRIFHYLNLSEDERGELAEAARRETHADTEGFI